MDYQSTILNSLEDVPDPPTAGRLLTSGCTIVVYVAHRLKRGVDALEPIDNGLLAVVDDDRSYSAKIRPASGLKYSALFDAGALPTSVARLVRTPYSPRIQQAFVTFGQEYALSVVPLVFSTNGTQQGTIELAQPLDVDALLRLMSLLSDPAEGRDLAAQVADSLRRQCRLPADSIDESWVVPSSFALQIWNLDGTAGRASGELYNGAAESAKYSWEISALLSYGADHLHEDGLWLRRSSQQVFTNVRSGMSFFDDHMVFVNSHCCLEMAHLPAWLRKRSAFRLDTYGYDSSSIFIWTAAVLRGVILSDLLHRYRGDIVQLTNRTMITTRDQAGYSHRQLQHAELVNRATNIRATLVEPRNQALDEKISIDRNSLTDAVVLDREMERCGDLATSLLRVNQENERSRRDSLLAVLGVMLATLQIPDFVDHVDEWVQSRDWLMLVISALLTMVPILLTLAVWRLRGASSGRNLS